MTQQNFAFLLLPTMETQHKSHPLLLLMTKNMQLDVLYHFPFTCWYLSKLSAATDRLANEGSLHPPLIIWIPRMAEENRQGGTGRARGNKNYSRAEIFHLLAILEGILPIGPEEWQAVADQHAVTYPEEARDTDSIRRKFANLHRKQIPTGDPSMPEEVKIAKRIKYKIGDKANIGDAEELWLGPLLARHLCMALLHVTFGFKTY